jgi:hypothetical protein
MNARDQMTSINTVRMDSRDGNRYSIVEHFDSMDQKKAIGNKQMLFPPIMSPKGAPKFDTN